MSLFLYCLCRETLRQIIEHRIGADRFIDSLSFVSQSEQFTRAAKHPQVGDGVC